MGIRKMTEQFVNFYAKHYRFGKNSRTNSYGVLSIKSNRYVDASTVFMHYSQAMNELGVDVGVTQDEVSKYITENMPSEQKEEKLPVSQFIEQWVKANGNYWHMSAAWKEIEYTDHGVVSPKDLDSLRSAIMLYIYDNGLKYGVDEVKTAVTVMAMKKQQEALKKMVDNIKYDPKYVEAGERYLRALYGFFKPTASFEKWCMMLRHWAWQVKRKVFNLEVMNHIWINFMGGTGLGKTTALKKMTSPLDDFVSQTTVAKLFDDTKEIKRLTENYVLIFDELALNVESETGGTLNADQKAILKSMLSGDKLDARVYGTQQQSKRKITFSCISSANTHLYDVIFDETSMRRFYEFDCKGTKPDSYDEINKFLDNSYVFWRSIDESLDEGYWDIHSEVGREICKEQGEYYPTKTTTSLWIAACSVTAGNTSGSIAYKSYSNWCKNTGNRSKNMQNFVRDIAHMLPDAMDSSGRAHLAWKDDDDDEGLPVFRQSARRMPDQYESLIGVPDDEDAA